jgi:hypothetical protein
VALVTNCLYGRTEEIVVDKERESLKVRERKAKSAGIDL